MSIFLRAGLYSWEGVCIPSLSYKASALGLSYRSVWVYSIAPCWYNGDFSWSVGPVPKGFD